MALVFLLFATISCLTFGVWGELEGQCECAVFQRERVGGWKDGDQLQGDWENCEKMSFSSVSIAMSSRANGTTLCDPMCVKPTGLSVMCDNQGENMCKQFCNAMAAVMKEKAPGLVCHLMGTMLHSLTPSIFVRTCNDVQEKMWTYSGITLARICCRNLQPTQCRRSSH